MRTSKESQNGRFSIPRNLVRALAAAAVVMIANPLHAQRMPRVYGPAGKPYGPTQAAYQYQRQYGRPWHGYGGAFFGGYPAVNYQIVVPGAYFGGTLGYGGYYGVPAYTIGVPFNGFGYGYGGYGYYPVAPYVDFGVPIPELPPNAVIERGLADEERIWGQPLGAAPRRQPVEEAVHPPPPKPIEGWRRKPSTDQAKLESRRLLVQGDEQFKRQNWLQAYSKYKQASDKAPDLAEPYFRMAFALASMMRYDQAVAEIQRGLEIDRGWPVHGESLSELFGEERLLAKSALLGEVTDWADRDIRNPDRLFLLGVLLHFDGQTERAKLLFDAAARLGDSPYHVMAFLFPEEKALQPAAGVREREPTPVPKRGAADGPAAPPETAVPPQPAEEDDEPKPESRVGKPKPKASSTPSPGSAAVPGGRGTGPVLP